MGPEFVAGEPAVLFGKKLVVADLHIGIEHEYYTSGVKLESQTHEMSKRLDIIIKQTKASELILLGDIKHKVPGISYQELREIPEFMKHFLDKLKVIVVMGNHDPGIENFAKVDVKPTEGFASDEVYFTHGHTWPSKDFLKCKYLIMGHIQPQIEFKDKLGYRWQEPVWVRSKLDPGEVKKKYGSHADLPEVLIIPGFNTLIGGHKINRKSHEKEHKTPIMKMLKLKESDIYLLDGTYLGKLKDL